MSKPIEIVDEVIIKFAGDSGDGIQLAGSQFTNNTALTGSDLSTFPDFPAEIRAPQGTLAGVSGFQLRFSSKEIFTPGDTCDVLVAMNAAALKSNLSFLKKSGIVIVNTAGFDAKNLRLANYADAENPLEDDSLSGYNVHKIDITKMTREALKETSLGIKEKDRAKNMFVLGYLYWMYDRKMDTTENFLNSKFKKKPEILKANISALKAGYNFGITVEVSAPRFSVEKANLPKGTYRNIQGNTALSYGLIAAAQKAKVDLFLGSYPITPASDILHELSKHKNFGVTTFQAEDEIAAISSAIGASYGGKLGITTTSGPGMALKAEAMGLATMLEIPLLIIDIQRGGPSTGLPTKTEQSDLLQAFYGRNGECPMPILATSSPSDCFETAVEACRIALQHMTPVILLSDGYIANGSEPWKFPAAADVAPIKTQLVNNTDSIEEYLPYLRDKNLVRSWAIPGMKNLEHRVGGLEKEDISGNVSYDPDNHEHMVKTRQAKVDKIADFIPEVKFAHGDENDEILVLGWGSTYGVSFAAVEQLRKEGHKVAQIHLRHIQPFAKNLGQLLQSFDKIVVPELNNGQLSKIIQSSFAIAVTPYNKIKGVPITQNELVSFVLGCIS
jgi:2-oxoglutarate ferredoxin oxidoreductase subunit alpha